MKKTVAGVAVVAALWGSIAQSALAARASVTPPAQTKAAQLASIRKGFAPAIAQLRKDEARLEHYRPLGYHAKMAIHSWITAAYALDSLDSPSSSANAVELLHWGDRMVDTLYGVEHGHRDPSGFIRSQKDLLPYEDIYNVMPDDRTVISGSYPSLEGLRWLKEHGVTAVVNFTADDHERALAAKVGLHYYQIAFPDHKPPTRAQVAEFLKIVAKEKADGGKVYTHCVRGVGRDHTMVACYLVGDKHESAAAAIEDGLSKVPNWTLDQDAKQSQFAFIRRYARSAHRAPKK